MNGIFAKKLINLTLILCMSAALLEGCGSHPNTATVTQHTGSALKKQEETVEEDTALVEEEPQGLYIVESLDMMEETIALYSLEEDKQLRYNYNMTTKFLDKFGGNALWASFTAGTVVTIGDLLPSSGALSSVQKSDDVWAYEDISKYTIDAGKNLITIDGTNYKITDKTKVYSDTEKILLSSISEDDVITVIGQDKQVISIAVTTGHGYIYLTNTELFDDSLIFIGNKIVSMVNGDQVIEVPEGTYKITVANNGWGGSGEYTVTRNETTPVNLDDLKGEGPSYCLITFIVTVADTYVYIDGEMIDPAEPQYVQYGNHKLVVQCDGYTAWNKTLVVNSETATITLEMETESESEAESDSGTTDSQVVQEDESTEEENSEESSTENETETEEKSDDYDYEVDYLSTISDLISKLGN